MYAGNSVKRRFLFRPTLFLRSALFLGAALLIGGSLLQCVSGGRPSDQTGSADRWDQELARAVERSADREMGEAARRGWRKNLRVFAQELPERHPNIFFRLPGNEYRRRINSLRETLPKLSSLQAEMMLRRLLAAVGDSHTALSLQGEAVYPLRFHWFEQGPYLMRAPRRYREFVGMRLTAVNGTPMAEVQKALEEIIPHENQAQIRKSCPAYLPSPRYLRGLGLLALGEPARFRFESAQDQPQTQSQPQGRTLEVEPTQLSGDIEWSRVLGDKVSLPKNTGQIPLYFNLENQVYFQEYRGEDKILYVHYRSCTEDPQKPFPDFAAEVMEQLENRPAEKMVIDMRFNGGGDSEVMRPLIQALIEDYREGRDYQLFVIIGRDTYSSAILNAVELKQKAGAFFAGEPTSGKPNHYGEVRTLDLPGSGLTLAYSTNYFRPYDGEADTLVPDKTVPWRYADFTSFRDAAMEAIRAW